MNQKRFAILFSTLYFVMSMMVLAGCVPGESTGTEVDTASSKAAYQWSMTDRHLFHDRLWLDRATAATSDPILPGNWAMVDRIRFQDHRDLPVSNPVVEGSMTMTERHKFHDWLWASQPGGSN